VQTWLLNNGESDEAEFKRSQAVLESLPDWDSSHKSGQHAMITSYCLAVYSLHIKLFVSPIVIVC